MGKAGPQIVPGVAYHRSSFAILLGISKIFSPSTSTGRRMPGGLREPFTGVLFTLVRGKSNFRQLVPGFGERHHAY